MTIVERLAELLLHLEHLREIRPRVGSAADLEADLSLRNDVLHSLQTVCQVVIDVAGDLAARAGLPFEDYTERCEACPGPGRSRPSWRRSSSVFPASGTCSSTSRWPSISSGSWPRWTSWDRSRSSPTAWATTWPG